MNVKLKYQILSQKLQNIGFALDKASGMLLFNQTSKKNQEHYFINFSFWQLQKVPSKNTYNKFMSNSQQFKQLTHGNSFNSNQSPQSNTPTGFTELNANPSAYISISAALGHIPMSGDQLDPISVSCVFFNPQLSPTFTVPITVTDPTGYFALGPNPPTKMNSELFHAKPKKGYDFIQRDSKSGFLYLEKDTSMLDQTIPIYFNLSNDSNPPYFSIQPWSGVDVNDPNFVGVISMSDYVKSLNFTLVSQKSNYMVVKANLAQQAMFIEPYIPSANSKKDKRF